MLNKFARNVAIAVLSVLLIGGYPSFAVPINPAIQHAVSTYHIRPGYKGPLTLRVNRVVISGPYALASWRDGDGGGQAVLVKKGTTWTVLTLGGGQFNAASMIEVGVPKPYADALAAKNR